LAHRLSKLKKLKKLNHPEESESSEDDTDEEGSFDADQEECKNSETYEQEFKFVFTQPPWDSCLKQTDRVFLLLPDTKNWKQLIL